MQPLRTRQGECVRGLLVGRENGKNADWNGRCGLEYNWQQRTFDRRDNVRTGCLESAL